MSYFRKKKVELPSNYDYFTSLEYENYREMGKYIMPEAIKRISQQRIKLVLDTEDKKGLNFTRFSYREEVTPLYERRYIAGYDFMQYSHLVFSKAAKENNVKINDIFMLLFLFPLQYFTGRQYRDLLRLNGFEKVVPVFKNTNFIKRMTIFKFKNSTNDLFCLTDLSKEIVIGIYKELASFSPLVNTKQHEIKKDIQEKRIEKILNKFDEL